MYAIVYERNVPSASFEIIPVSDLRHFDIDNWSSNKVYIHKDSNSSRQLLIAALEGSIEDAEETKRKGVSSSGCRLRKANPRFLESAPESTDEGPGVENAPPKKKVREAKVISLNEAERERSNGLLAELRARRQQTEAVTTAVSRNVDVNSIKCIEDKLNCLSEKCNYFIESHKLQQKKIITNEDTFRADYNSDMKMILGQLKELTKAVEKCTKSSISEFGDILCDGKTPISIGYGFEISAVDYAHSVLWAKGPTSFLGKIYSSLMKDEVEGTDTYTMKAAALKGFWERYIRFKCKDLTEEEIKKLLNSFTDRLRYLKHNTRKSVSPPNSNPRSRKRPLLDNNSIILNSPENISPDNSLNEEY